MKLKTGTLAALALPLALSTSASRATEARIDSMGGGVKLWTIEDESNIFDYPSLLVRWGNRVYIDNLHPGTEGGELFPNGRFGFHYNLSDDTVIAFVGSHTNSVTRPVGSGFVPTGNAFTGGQAFSVAFQASLASDVGGDVGDGTVGADALGYVDQRYGILFATQLGAKTRFGLSFNVAGDNADIESPNVSQVDQGALLFDIALGLGVDLDGSELELSAGVEFGILEDFRDEADAISGVPGDLLEHWSGSHFGLRLNGRWTFDFFDQTKIVAYTQFMLGSQSIDLINTASIPAESGSYSGLSFALGADLRIEPFQDVIVSPGLGFLISQQTVEGPNVIDRDADRLLSLPFYGLGVDLKLTDWFRMRFGANQYVNMLRQSQTSGGVTATVATSDVITSFAWGFGLNLPVAESNLAIDFSLNPTFFNNGPHVLTGNATGPFALNAGVRYNW